MKELHSTILMNVGLLSLASIYLLPPVSAEVKSNRCPKESPYPFRNETHCCSRPVDFQWRKDGYCYGRTQKCTYTEGCVNFHPLCDFIDKIIAIGFPSDGYNKIYEPSLLPTISFSHRFIFKESSTTEDYEYEEEVEEKEIHCLWRDDLGKWILGLCENIESNVGQYFLDTDSECPNTDNSWKDFENNIIVDANVRELKDRIVSGQRASGRSRATGLFASTGARKKERVRKCVDWMRNPFTNKWKCKKFFPPIKRIRKKLKTVLLKAAVPIKIRNVQVSQIVQGNNEVELRNDVENLEDTLNETDDSESDYGIDSILSDIF